MKNTDCNNCNGYPCICKELKDYKPVSTIFMLDEKRNEMFIVGYIPPNPYHTRMLNNSVLLA